MNSSKLSNINLCEFLATKGITPIKQLNSSAWYISPFRDEKTPSFKIDTNRNLWYDFGEGDGGNIISFLCKYYNVGTKEAYDILKGTRISVHVPKLHSSNGSKKSSGIKILRTSTTIESYQLALYLRARNINVEFAQNCGNLFEIEYSIADKRYFALGFVNDKGGFEIRNSFFKGSSSPKAISTVPGNPEILNVFEGFMDYLSALSYYKMTSPTNTSIILNGVGQVKEIIPLLSKFRTVNLFLDNDKAGKKTVDLILSHHSNVINQSQRVYPLHKDFNEFTTRKTA